MVTPYADAGKTALDGIRDALRGQGSLGTAMMAASTSAAVETMMAGVVGKVVKKGGRYIAAFEMRVTEKVIAHHERSIVGRALRMDAIPAGSKLEYLAPGRVKFDGVEFRAVRDLSHLGEAELKEMVKKGKAFRDINGNPMHGHHYLQLDHRHPDGFIVEIPGLDHNAKNMIQHPKPVGEGLPEAARKEWNNVLREAYYKERARTELLRRGLVE